MNRSSIDSAPETASWEPKYPFDLVVAYEDTTTRNQAMQLYDHLAQNLLDDYDFQCTWWRFDHFRNPSLREQAADAAAEANMIIVCLRNGEILPELARVWIQTWLPRKDERKSALVTLVGDVEHAHRESCPANLYLQKIARVSQMDFFSHSFDLLNKRTRMQANLDQRALSPNPPMLHPAPHPTRGQPRWGINE